MSNQRKTADALKVDPDSDADAADFSDIAERRGAFRQPAFLNGEVILPGGDVLPCIVRNFSEGGCLIKLDQAANLPDDIEIRLEIDKPAQAVEIVWRSTTLAGAMFVRKLN